jgi:hypothetical protein
MLANGCPFNGRSEPVSVDELDRYLRHVMYSELPKPTTEQNLLPTTDKISALVVPKIKDEQR